MSYQEKNKITISEAITRFSIEVLQIEETKNNPELILAITELLKIGRVSNLRIWQFDITDIRTIKWNLCITLKGVRMGLKEVILVVSIIIALVVAIPVIIDNHKMIKEMEELLD